MNRRRFLASAFMAAGAAAIAVACGEDERTAHSPGSGSPDERQPSAGDADISRFAAGLEVLAVDTYRALREATAAGRMGAVPPAGDEFLRTALAHHEEHLAAWNRVLTDGGKPAVTAPNGELKPIVDSQRAGLRDFAGAARLSLTLEEAAAATYLSVVPVLKGKEAIRQAASIQAVDAKHVAILLFLLGEYPIPDSFAKTEKAAKLA